MNCPHWSRKSGYARASLYAACPWCELERLRNDLSAARLDIAILHRRIRYLGSLHYLSGEAPRPAVAGDIGWPLTEDAYAAGIPPWCGVRGIEAHKCMMLCWSLCATLERGESMTEEDCRSCEEYSPGQSSEHPTDSPFTASHNRK